MSEETWSHDDPRWQPHAEASPILQHMLRHKMPLTRKKFIALNWGPDKPEHWGAEDEAEIPEPLREAHG